MLSEPDARGAAVYLGELEHWIKEETGYQWIQGTKPQTLAFGLTDSPAGLAAWIVEKFRSWSDCGGDVERAVGKDEMLANISLYWFTGAIGSSFWPYYARLHGPWPIPDSGHHRADRAMREFPREILQAAALGGRAHLQEHPALERDAARRPLRGDGAARSAGARDRRVLPTAEIATRKNGRCGGRFLARCRASSSLRPRPSSNRRVCRPCARLRRRHAVS